MKKQLIIIGIIVILLTVGLSGCNEDYETKKYSLIGIWNQRDNQDNQMIFNQEMTFFIVTSTSGPLEGYYTINKTVITITFLQEGIKTSADIEYRFLSEDILSVKMILDDNLIEAIYDKV